MCVIAYKPRSTTISKETLTDMWEHNPDGAGLAFYNEEQNIVIMKGFMELSDLWLAVQPLQKLELVIHLRWATHGLTTPAQTHPFVISEKERIAKGYNTADMVPEAVLFHNGVLTNFGDKRISDTLDFVLRVLGPMKRKRKSEALLETWKDLLKTVGSKYAIMYDGEIELVGHFQRHKGLEVSNNNFNFTYGGYETVTSKTKSGVPVVSKRWVEKPSRAITRRQIRENAKKPKSTVIRTDTIARPSNNVSHLPATKHGAKEVVMHPYNGGYANIPEDLDTLLNPEQHIDNEILNDFEFREDVPDELKTVLRRIEERRRGEDGGGNTD